MRRHLSFCDISGVQALTSARIAAEAMHNYGEYDRNGERTGQAGFAAFERPDTHGENKD